jgi:tRNA A37 N6-isopentenylltransferase MiaA
VEELIKRMIDETEPRPLFNALEYRKVIAYLKQDRDSYKETVDRFMWGLVDKCKP